MNEEVVARSAMQEEEARGSDEPAPGPIRRRARTRRTEQLQVDQPRKRARRDPDHPLVVPEAEAGASEVAGDGQAEREMDLEGDEEMGILDILLLYSNEEHVQGTGHVSEIYSPPRVAPVAASFGLQQGYSLDLTTCGPDGEIYDFDKRSCRKKARQLIREKRPGLLICSPMCTAFSNLLKMNRSRMGETRYQQWMAKGRRHLRFVMELCQEQMKSGNYFLFEHPAFASSWTEPEVIKLVKENQVWTVIVNMCRFGMTSQDDDGSVGPVAKPTRFATNSQKLAQALDQRCPGDHQHVHLLNHRAAAAQIYPPELCKAIVT